MCFCLLALGNCASPQGNTLKLIDSANAGRLQASYGTADALQKRIDAAQDDPVKRNVLLNDLILIVDLNYYEWEKRLFSKKAAFDLGTNAALLGLGGATALASATGTANILGQISTGITGFKASVDTDILQKNSIPSLVSKMRAARQTQLAKMQAAMIQMQNKVPTGPSPVDLYSVEQGLLDLNVYYAAGTFVGALQDITAKAAEEKKAADEKINALKLNAPLINNTPDLPTGKNP
jgi:hypothetical protein